MSNTARHRHVLTIASVLLAAAACGNAPERAGVGPDATAAVADEPGGPAPLDVAAVRAAHIATRQAEGATSPRYHIAADGGLLRTAHHRGVAARFDDGGVTFTSEAGPAGRLETVAVRCGARELARPTGAPAIDPAAPHRVVRGASADLREWFVNGPLGLEHGFDLGLAGCATRLTVELATPGLVPSRIGADLRLTSTDGGLILRYGDLFVRDADGRPLPARFGHGPDRAWIEVDVAGARGPIEIDPLLYAELQKVGPTLDHVFPPGGRAGSVVAVEGDTALVTGPLEDVDGRADQGAVYVYGRRGGGAAPPAWAREAVLVAADGQAGHTFGRSASLFAGTIAVGAPGASGGAGAIYVFTRSGPGWAQVTKIDGAALDAVGLGRSLIGADTHVAAYATTTANAPRLHYFTLTGGQPGWTVATVATPFPVGSNVALAITPAEVLVGADLAGGGTGQVWFYSRASQSFVGSPISGGAIGDRLGSSIAASGPRFVVGSPGADPAGLVDAGIVRFYQRSPLVVEGSQLGTAAGEQLGAAVTMAGDRAAVAAPGASGGAGRVAIFNRDVNGWRLDPAPQSGPAPAAGDRLGGALAMADTTLLVGVPQDDVNGDVDRGSVNVLVRVPGPPAAWALQQRLLADDSTDGDVAGTAVALAGDTAVVGAAQDELDGRPGAGAAYVYRRSGALWQPVQKLAGDGPAGEAFGTSLALWDGLLVVGAPGGGPGATYVFARNGARWVPQGRIVPAGAAPGDRAGQAVALEGDTLLVGADRAAGGQGAVFAFRRNGPGWAPDGQPLLAPDGAPGARFGASVALSGDAAVVGAPASAVGGAGAGAAYAFARAGGVWSLDQTLATGAPGAQLGSSVALAGPRALVGAPGDAGRGSAHAFVRGGSAWTADGPPLVHPAGADGDRFGASVALTGNLALVGVVFDSAAGVPGRGSAYVFLRDGGAWIVQTELLASDGATGDQFGASAVALGGPSVTGYTTLLGAPFDDGAQPDQGAAYFGELEQVGPCAGQVAGTVCRAATGACDLAEVCDGVHGECPADEAAPAGTTCGDGTDTGCDNPDTCDGLGACVDNLEPVGAACGDGTDSVCDHPDTCDGAGACLTNPEPATTVCRADAGACDVAETCDGLGACPADTFEPAGTACGDGGDSVCDNPDSCDGSGACAANAEPATTECRPDAGDCDVAETCDGLGACPPDRFEPIGTACGDGTDTVCDDPDSCDGLGTCAANAEPATTICRADAGDCDVAETCDGLGACPADTFEPAGTTCGDGTDSVCDNPDSCDGGGACAANAEPATTICRADAGECDVAETCDGLGACPADTFEPAGTACGDGTDTACDNPDSCDGGGACAANVEPATTICRADAGDCDVAETCDGLGACPADTFEPAGTACGDGTDSVCDDPDTCDAGGGCQANAEPATTVCRPGAGGCDVAESCDGAGACPADGFVAAGTECRPSAGACDVAEACTGGAAACPADDLVAAGTECRPSAGACDVAEACTGASTTCPADGFVAAGTECRPSAGACDVAEACTGASTTCPADGFVAAGTECRPSAGACDVAEACTGDGGACPADGFVPAGTECRPSAGACDVAEACTGDGGACPADALAPAGTACDPAGETCQASAEVCTGASTSCPADDTTACQPPPPPPQGPHFTTFPSPVIVGHCQRPSRLRYPLRPQAVDEQGRWVPVVCESITGVGVHDDVLCTAYDWHGRTATTTITVTVLARLRVAFQAPLLDDNKRNNVHHDRDVVNKFRSGSTVAHNVKLYACDGADVTQALSSSVSVHLHVTERSQFTDSLIVDVPETYSGVGGPGGLMAFASGQFRYNLRTNGYETNTYANGRYFRSLVKVAYNTHPTITVGREDARLESKP